MKNDKPKTNYLAGAKKSNYDGLQRRVSSLIQHWMDHTSGIKPSRLIPLLCDYIDSTDFSFVKCDESEIFSTKSDYILGLIIGYFIEIQDEEGEHLKEKRKEIETVLAQFSRLTSQTPSETVNLTDINNPPKPENTTQTEENPLEQKWWLKFLDIFTKMR